MDEHTKIPLVSQKAFLSRLAKNFVIGFSIILCSLYLGMCGYHYFEDLSWMDAFANAAMILSGMGPLNPLKTDAGKLFAGIYALFSGVIFLLVVGIIFAPIIHRFLHRFHLALAQESEKKRK